MFRTLRTNFQTHPKTGISLAILAVSLAVGGLTTDFNRNANMCSGKSAPPGSLDRQVYNELSRKGTCA
jgi:hypothetical protein